MQTTLPWQPGSIPLMLSTVAVLFSLSACIDGMVTRSLIEFYADPPAYQNNLPEYKQVSYRLVQDTGEPAPPFQVATVIRVVDGDTIKVRLNALEERSVRLIGVDTPETVHPRRPEECFGPEASEYLLVYEGYGRAYTKYPFAYKDLFVEAERQAKKARRGLWSACPEA